MTRSMGSDSDTFNGASVVGPFAGMKVETFSRPGVTYPFQRLQEVLPFFELLDTDNDFVSCTFGNIL